MTNINLPILLSIFVVVVLVIVAVVDVAIVDLVNLDALTLSLIPQKIAIYPQYPRPMESASTST